MIRKVLISLAAAVMLGTSLCAQPDTQEFRDVPREYRPRVWWHWMNGNVTKDGIRKDLEWMDRAGIVGFHNFDAGCSTPQIVDERLIYMTPEWKDAFNYALDIADSLGMEVSIASSPGWSITGGPWVSKEDAEKKLVWREMELDGGQHFSGELPEPFIMCGPRQDIVGIPDDPHRYDFYKDLYVIAVKAPEADTARILRVDVKSGMVKDYTVADHFPTPDTEDVTALSDVIDITGCFDGGKLSWDVPEGRWKIFRFGYNLLGRVNGPASPEATGLEVDKLDADAVRRYYKNYLDMYRDASGDRLGSVISHLMIDSYESGLCSWTPKMEEEFKARRGYSLRPWMPVLTGQIIVSADKSERFLFDWRQTLGELIAENHYDVVNEILAPYGMKRHTESHEERTAFVGDGMMVKRHADIPMSAFWVRFNAGWHSTYPVAEADLKESSSVAHIYGQNVCAAESFTTNGRIGKWDGFGAYQCCPRNLKPVADAAMAMGLNRFIIHTSVHQPVDDKFPGLGLSTYGQWFTRQDTWAEEARPWTDYLARSCYMLQQGRYVADIAYFYGEDKNVTGRFNDERVEHVDGFNYDFVNADILLNMVRTRKRSLVTGTGMEYKILVIDSQVRYMSWPVLRRLLKFARAGVVICGPRPLSCANLKADDRKFERTVAKIWDRGRKNVHETMDAGASLAAAGVRKDLMQFVGGSEQPTDSVSFVHRKLSDGDIYWVANISSSPRAFEASLRTSGLKPQIWNAEDGSVKDVSYAFEGDRTRVSLSLTPDESLFIVLRGKADETSVSIAEKTVSESAEIRGPWKVKFQEGRGAPSEAVFPELISYTESPVEGIKYFSGTATYETTFELATKSDGMILDLGEVREMARVILNGRDLGLLWRPPYRMDVSGALIEGENRLQLKVTNTWANRLIGDEKASEGKRITYTVMQFYQATDEPVTSGLLGPVRILETK